MKRISSFRLLAGVTSAALAAALACSFVLPKQAVLAADAPASPQAAPALSADLVRDKSLFTDKCSACHNLPKPEEQNMNRAQWARTVERMRVKYGATDLISPDDAAHIVDYLATFAPNPGKNGGRSALDPWGSDSTDVWSVEPTATQVFNFETPAALDELSPLSAGVSGPAPVWKIVVDSEDPNGHVVRVHAVKPNPARFALLMDRHDAPRNLDIRVRFRIDHGALSPTVGLVFGFASPKSYYLLAYKAKTSELTLMRMAEPVHTTLQSTPFNPAAPQLAAAATASAPLSSGWHTLRVLVNNGQIRGWLDGYKRVSTTDSGYAGGKVGLWTQGDTVASFDDWIVDVYDAPAAVAASAPATL